MNAHGKDTKTRFRARAGALALAVAAALGGTLPAQAGGDGIRVKSGIKGVANMNYRCQGPDPAVVSFRVGRIQRIDRYNARVELVATIRNLGTEDLGDTRGKLGAAIAYRPAGGRSGRVLASIELRDLPKGRGAMRIVRGWTHISTSQEFPGTFSAYVSGDPDWQTQFDCNATNNLRRLSERDVMNRVAQVLQRAPQGRAYEAIQRERYRRAQDLISPKAPKPVFGR